MEPNQNMENNNPFVGAPVSEQAITEQVTETQMGPASMEPAALPEKKKSNGILIGLILCLVLAAGGIGFGVFAMMDGNAQKESLNKQISELKKTNNDLMDKLNNTTVVDDDTIIDVNTDSNVNTEDYIYVGEWGLKIKKPEGLKRVSYSLRQSSAVDGGLFLFVWGNIDDRLPDFADPSSNTNPLGVISRLPISSLGGEDCHSGTFELVFSDGDYNYCYSHPQGISAPEDSEMYGSEKTTVELIQGMLETKDNYSAI